MLALLWRLAPLGVCRSDCGRAGVGFSQPAKGRGLRNCSPTSGSLGRLPQSLPGTWEASGLTPVGFPSGSGARSLMEATLAEQ